MENYLHAINIESKTKINVTGVVEVCEFTEKEIKLKIKDNSHLLILGDNLKIKCFDDKNGNFTAIGVIDLVRYKGGSESVIKKVFK